MPLQAVIVADKKRLLKTEGHLANECCCVDGGCTNVLITFTLTWSSNADLDVYAQLDTEETVYWAHMASATLSLNVDAHRGCNATAGPEIITGSIAAIAAGVTRYVWVWYNRYSTCGTDAGAETASVEIKNNGTTPICVTVGASSVTVAPDADTSFSVMRSTLSGSLGSTNPTTIAAAVKVEIKCAACPE